MKLALFGASGMIGFRILTEALRRNHQVTAIVRDPSKIVLSTPNLHVVAGNVLDPRSVAELTAGHDAVISAYSPGVVNTQGSVTEAARSLIQGLALAKIKRLIVVGGAGSLEVAPGVDLIDSGHLPQEWKAIAIDHRDALKVLKDLGSSLEWTSVSPAAFIQPGERTGVFRIGEDKLLTDAAGQSRISAEDFADALLNEVESPHFIRRRFTVAY